MENFANQCLDMARALLGHNLAAIQEDGSIAPTDGETMGCDEPGHAALAIGEFFRATQERVFESYDLIDLAARCITAQAFTEDLQEGGLACAALALLSFGPAKDRNPVWERLMEPTQEQLDRCLLARSDYLDYRQAFNVAKAVARYSMGLSKQDETSKLINRFLERISHNSFSGFCDNGPKDGIGGVFDLSGVMCFVFIRQALQLHSNPYMCTRKLPSLRTFGEKYLRLLPDLVREDGLGWAYGHGIGAYGQMPCISILLQGMRDCWISDDKRSQYNAILRRLFQFFFMTWLDQEHGVLVIRDAERDTPQVHTTRMANFDGARYLCQWSRLARSIGGDLTGEFIVRANRGRLVIFDKSNNKEQGLFIYQNSKTGLHIQLPLVSNAGKGDGGSLAFPHCPGVFDWPVEHYEPILLPELTIGEHTVVPCFYGKRCTAGMGLRQAFYFRYEQPELITLQEKLLPGLGCVKVSWTFSDESITGDFIFTFKRSVQLDTA